MEQPSEAQQAAHEILLAFAEAIRDLGSISSGNLYARLMGTFTIDEYSVIIAKLQTIELIEIENNLITWIGE